MSSTTFLPPPSHLRLSANEVHIWIASLAQAKTKINNFAPILSNKETNRSKCFYFDSDRERYIVAHGILKIILGRYLDLKTGKLQFCFGKNGKPAISTNCRNQDIRFNLSYSESIALYALTLYHEIGIDVEMVRDIPEMEEIAKRCFSINEYSIYRSSPERKKKDVFYEYWTRKEAFCKATGDGLSLPLEKFDVFKVKSDPVKLLRAEGDTNGSSQWFIYDLNIGPGCKAAFAIEGQCCEFLCFQW